MKLQRGTGLISVLIPTLLFFHLSFAQVPDCAISWDAPIQLSSDHVLSNASQIAVSGGTIHVVWFGFDTLGTETSDGVQYARSTDGGASFSPQITISSM